MDINRLLTEMTLEEKCRMLVGLDSWHTISVPRLDIPSIMMADGPHGLRKQLDSTNNMMVNESYKAVCFPPAVTIAASFDPLMTFKMGEAIANECLHKDVQVLLGPGINIKRSPLCGRNFEYYSEDPYLTGEMASGFVRGLQSKNIGACVKHFALNSQETYRMVSNSVADKRAFYEIYTSAFKRVVKENPDMAMCSYNRVEGIYASENKWLLKDVLRTEFGFKNVIVSDWTAVNDRSDALNASLDLEMPGHDYAVKKLIRDFHSGKITMPTIDASVRTILELVDRKRNQKIVPFDLEINHETAYEIAKESMVLLKNNDNILPLEVSDKIAVIGRLAKTVRYQGGGSSHINPYKVESMLDHLPENVHYHYADGYRLEGDGYSSSLIEEARALAVGQEKVVLILGLTDVYESEGYDRTHLDLPFGHTELLKAVLEVNQNVIVVLQLGSPVVMPWINDVKAVLNAYLAGEAGARAIIDLLYGKVNPSGRLAETFPLSLESTPAKDRFAKGNGDVYYQESIYVGYRYYTSKNVAVLFPFGHGLSYTEFAYANLVIGAPVTDHPGTIAVSVDVTNIGKRSGKEVIQLYIQNPETGVYKAKRELKRIDKVHLEPNETKTIKFTISTEELGYYDPAFQGLITEPGNYTVQIMKNAQEPILEAMVQVNNPLPVIQDASLLKAASYYIRNGLKMETSDFEVLIGRPLQAESIKKRRPFDLNNTLLDIRGTFLGGIMYRAAKKAALKASSDMSMETRQMVEKSLGETPLRAIVVFSGVVKMTLMMGILELINHHPIKAIRYFMGRA
jgi:beta-glucosidase